MKLTVTFKDPDVVYEAIRDAVKEEVDALESLDEDEKEALVETRSEKVSDILDNWITYGEYVTIEFDTVAKTAMVKPAK